MKKIRKLWKRARRVSPIDLGLWVLAIGAIFSLGTAALTGGIKTLEKFGAIVPERVEKTAMELLREERQGRHLGFDTYTYPGDEAMKAWRSEGSPYEWVGYYLTGACHRGTTWNGKRERLAAMGWGTAVVYVGQQTWGKIPGQKRLVPQSVVRNEKVRIKKKGKTYLVSRKVRRTIWVAEPPPRQSSNCHTELVKGDRGVLDAYDAIAKTEIEGFPLGSTIFLDIEHMDHVPERMKEYYKAWTQTVLADGRYKVGYYVHTRNADVVYSDIKEIFVAAGYKSDPPFWIAGKTSLFNGELGPEYVGHAFAALWQGILDRVDVQAGFEIPVDINVAKVPDPSAKAHAITE